MKLHYPITIFLLMVAGLYAEGFTLNSEYNLSSRPVGIFVDDLHVYLLFDNKNRVYEYSVDGKQLVQEKLYGSEELNSKDYMFGPRDIWIEGDYLYVLDSSNAFYKFEKRDGLVVVGKSEPYIPESGAAIVVYKENVYLLDKERGQVTIASEYEKNKYMLNQTINSVYLNTSVVRLSYPNDMFIDDERIYIADTDNNRILILNIGLENVSSGSGISYIYVKLPHYVAVDKSYVYVVDRDAQSVQVFLKSDYKKIGEINSSVYQFSDICGLYSHDDKLYVIDSIKKKLVVLDINRTQSIKRDDVLGMYEKFNESVDEVCTLYSIAREIYGKDEVEDRCNDYRETLGRLKDAMNKSDYDYVYNTILSNKPTLDGDIAFLRHLVESKLNEMKDELKNKTSALAALSSSFNSSVETIRKELENVESMISSRDYENAVAKLKEIKVRIEVLEDMIRDLSNKTVFDEYREELTSLKSKYGTIREELLLYKISFEERVFYSYLENASSAINASDLEHAYKNIYEAQKMLYDAEAVLNNKKKDVLYVNQTISKVYEEIYAIRNSSLPFISPDTSKVELLLANATTYLYVDPLAAKEYSESALSEAKKIRKELEDTMFMIGFAIAAVIFIIIILGLITSGVIKFIIKK